MQVNNFLTRLDLFDIYTTKFEEFKDLCRPDSRIETTASINVITLRNTIVEACVKGLEMLLKLMSENISTGESCDLHPLTGNLLHCCKELIGFSQVYVQLVDLSREIGIPFPNAIVTLPEFILAILNNLLTSIKMKADRFKANKEISANIFRELNIVTHSAYEGGEKEAEDVLALARKHLFLSNNLFSMVIYLHEKKRELQVMVENSTQNNQKKGATAMLQYYKQIVQMAESVDAGLGAAQSEFCKIVAGSMGMNIEDMRLFKELNDKDKSGKHRVLKAKFTVFNTGLEAFLSLQGEWRISAAVLREFLTKQLVERVLPVYSEFFNAFSTTHFSKKHMNQYIKYPPTEVERVLKNFFGKA